MLDVKNRDFLTWPGRLLQDRPPKPGEVQHRIQVWVPELETPEAIEAWQWGIKDQAKRRNQAAFIIYDELTALIYGSQMSEEFRRIQKVGGGLSLGTFALTQEFTKIPSTAITQSQHFLCWRVGQGYDTVVATGLLQQKPVWGAKYSFLYKDRESDAPAYLYPNVSEFLHAA